MSLNPRKIKKIQLDSIPSTNAFIKDLLQRQNLDDFTLVVTDEQTSGRGQMGASWESKKGRNIALSLYKTFDKVLVEQQFFISMAVSLAVYDTLKTFISSKIEVKWPNDILVEGKKVAGILIETTLNSNRIQSAIIGIGINVNQTSFVNLPMAQSLIQLTGTPLDRDEVIDKLMSNLEKRFHELASHNYLQIKEAYESKLYKKGVVSLFRTKDFGGCNGIVKGVNDKGQLEVELEDRGLQKFNLKEIEFLRN
jgi:BirA family biotin operon repressor/biotin-[acetyl-CoA-carboxylase] ligase